MLPTRHLPSSSCTDNPTYIDFFGLTCSYHRLYTKKCDDAIYIGYSNKFAAELKSNCRKSCKTCNVSDELQGSQTYPSEMKANDYMINKKCHDKSTYKDKLGMECSQYGAVRNCNTFARYIGFSDKEIAELVTNCPISCDLCNKSESLDILNEISPPTTHPTLSTIPPSEYPIHQSSDQPSNQPSRYLQPSNQPSRYLQPSKQPSSYPSNEPFFIPSFFPSHEPSRQDQSQHTNEPHQQHSFHPSLKHPQELHANQCIDNEKFLDENGFECKKFREISCSMLSIIGYTNSNEINANCPKSCNQCNEETKTLTCEDHLNFKDHLGLTCKNHHYMTHCVQIEGYTVSDIISIQLNCPKSCGLCPEDTIHTDLKTTYPSQITPAPTFPASVLTISPSQSKNKSNNTVVPRASKIPNHFPNNEIDLTLLVVVVTITVIFSISCLITKRKGKKTKLVCPPMYEDEFVNEYEVEKWNYDGSVRSKGSSITTQLSRGALSEYSRFSNFSSQPCKGGVRAMKSLMDEIDSIDCVPKHDIPSSLLDKQRKFPVGESFNENRVSRVAFESNSGDQYNDDAISVITDKTNNTKKLTSNFPSLIYTTNSNDDASLSAMASASTLKENMPNLTRLSTDNLPVPNSNNLLIGMTLDTHSKEETNSEQTNQSKSTSLNQEETTSSREVNENNAFKSNTFRFIINAMQKKQKDESVLNDLKQNEHTSKEASERIQKSSFTTPFSSFLDSDDTLMTSHQKKSSFDMSSAFQEGNKNDNRKQLSGCHENVRQNNESTSNDEMLQVKKKMKYPICISPTASMSKKIENIMRKPNPTEKIDERTKTNSFVFTTITNPNRESLDKGSDVSYKSDFSYQSPFELKKQISPREVEVVLERCPNYKYEPIRKAVKPVKGKPVTVSNYIPAPKDMPMQYPELIITQPKNACGGKFSPSPGLWNEQTPIVRSGTNFSDGRTSSTANVNDFTENSNKQTIKTTKVFTDNSLIEKEEEISNKKKDIFFSKLHSFENETHSRKNRLRKITKTPKVVIESSLDQMKKKMLHKFYNSTGKTDPVDEEHTKYLIHDIIHPNPSDVLFDQYDRQSSQLGNHILMEIVGRRKEQYRKTLSNPGNEDIIYAIIKEARTLRDKGTPSTPMRFLSLDEKTEHWYDLDDTDIEARIHLLLLGHYSEAFDQDPDNRNDLVLENSNRLVNETCETYQEEFDKSSLESLHFLRNNAHDWDDETEKSSPRKDVKDFGLTLEDSGGLSLYSANPSQTRLQHAKETASSSTSVLFSEGADFDDCSDFRPPHQSEYNQREKGNSLLSSEIDTNLQIRSNSLRFSDFSCVNLENRETVESLLSSEIDTNLQITSNRFSDFSCVNLENNETYNTMWEKQRRTSSPSRDMSLNKNQTIQSYGGK